MSAIKIVKIAWNTQIGIENFCSARFPTADCIRKLLEKNTDDFSLQELEEVDQTR